MAETLWRFPVGVKSTHSFCWPIYMYNFDQTYQGMGHAGF